MDPVPLYLSYRRATSRIKTTRDNETTCFTIKLFFQYRALLDVSLHRFLFSVDLNARISCFCSIIFIISWIRCHCISVIGGEAGSRQHGTMKQHVSQLSNFFSTVARWRRPYAYSAKILFSNYLNACICCFFNVSFIFSPNLINDWSSLNLAIGGQQYRLGQHGKRIQHVSHLISSYSTVLFMNRNIRLKYAGMNHNCAAKNVLPFYLLQ